MNFFQAQDSARRKTWQLAAMFLAAVVTLIVLTNILVAVVMGFGGNQMGLTFGETLASTPADTWFWISGGIIGLVAVASLYKYLSIQGGGRTIAESLGGRLIHQSTQDGQQRQLLNVVEEMAIASGIPVPPVYLIPEPSINAFAAGFNADDAVIGINQGTLDALDRRELQGVVAHEFSHILNGDTNINLRLIAILHGILFLGMIGYGLLRLGGLSRRNGAPMLALGIGMLVIGYGGTFFGNMIKAAVSRQREYLADASAVQFTRDPDSIAGALKKIGGHSLGSSMQQEKAKEASHMFFGAIGSKFSGLFATHPPLDKRIRAIDPAWNGQFIAGRHSAGQDRELPPQAAGFAGAGTSSGTGTGTGETVDALLTGAAVVDHIGNPDAHSLSAAQQLIADNPQPLRHAAHDPFEARALVYAMLLDGDTAVAAEQLQFIAAAAENGVFPHIERLAPMVAETDAEHRLTLLEMAMPALKELSKPQYQRFMQNAARLITADRQVDMFEWVLHRVLTKELRSHFEGPQNSHGRIGKISKVAPQAARLLAILACQGHSDADLQQQAYQAGMAELDLDIAFDRQQFFDYEQLNQSLGKLRELKPLVKPALIKACATTVLHDQVVSADERALLHGIAATLDCPLPPHL